MSRFNFPYEALLSVRRSEERTQQQVVGVLESRRRDLEDELRRRQRFLETNREFARTSLTGSVDIDGLRLNAGLAVEAMRRADVIVLEIADLHRRMREAREVLVEHMRRRRAVERLRERMFERWKRRRRQLENRLEEDASMIRTAWQEEVA